MKKKVKKLSDTSKKQARKRMRLDKKPKKGQRLFNVPHAKKINYVSDSDIDNMYELWEIINGMGIYLDYRCARLVDGEQCLGSLSSKKVGTMYCKMCGAKWINKDEVKRTKDK